VNGRYTFRCRDSHEHFTESHGPDGNPLQLRVAEGKAEIWHFSITKYGLAYVFVITDQPLNKVDGKDLMTQSEKLGAKSALVYIRNDPWFFASSPDTGPYIFAEDRGYEPITEEEYLKGRTTSCRDDLGRKVMSDLELAKP